MSDPNSFDLPSMTSLGGAGLAGTLGFAFKALLDWTISRHSSRAEASKTEAEAVNILSGADDRVREDMLMQLRDQRAEIISLRTELTDARRELREFSKMYVEVISEWQSKYGALLTEVAELRAAVQRQNALS